MRGWARRCTSGPITPEAIGAIASRYDFHPA